MTLQKIIASLLAGLLFGIGLAISGMTNPHKVLNFLDLTGDWDPSLALVMAAAVPVSALGFAVARRRPRPFFGLEFSRPANRQLELSLWTGSALFGIGWGLAGYCPGPAVASLSNPGAGLILFLMGLAAGLLLSGPAARVLPTGVSHA